MSENKGYLITIALLFVLVVLLFFGLDLYTDLAWLETLGITSVFWRRIVTEWLLFILAWVVASVVLTGNWWLARKLAGGGQMAIPWLRQVPSQGRQPVAEPTARVIAARVATVLVAALGITLGLLLALPWRSMWLTALTSFQSVSFDEVDPILNHDISFYVFRLPWLQFLQGWFLWLVLLSLGGAALVYLGSYSAAQLASRVKIVDVRQPWLRLSRAAEGHLSVLGAIALGLFAWGYQLNQARLLYSTSGAAYGAGYTDVHARLPVMYLLTGIAALGAVLLLVNIVARVRWLPYIAVGAWLAVALLGPISYPAWYNEWLSFPMNLSASESILLIPSSSHELRSGSIVSTRPIST